MSSLRLQAAAGVAEALFVTGGGTTMHTYLFCLNSIFVLPLNEHTVYFYPSISVRGLLYSVGSSTVYYSLQSQPVLFPPPHWPEAQHLPLGRDDAHNIRLQASQAQGDNLIPLWSLCVHTPVLLVRMFVTQF